MKTIYLVGKMKGGIIQKEKHICYITLFPNTPTLGMISFKFILN
jgi:hypothetical protein